MYPHNTECLNNLARIFEIFHCHGSVTVRFWYNTVKFLLAMFLFNISGILLKTTVKQLKILKKFEIIIYEFRFLISKLFCA